MEVSKDILRQVLIALGSSRGDGELSIRVSFKDGIADSPRITFASSKFLSRLEASPLYVAEEKFVNSHHEVAKKTGRLHLDPLGILTSALDGKISGKKEPIGRVAGRPTRKA